MNPKPRTTSIKNSITHSATGLLVKSYVGVSMVLTLNKPKKKRIDKERISYLRKIVAAKKLETA